MFCVTQITQHSHTLTRCPFIADVYPAICLSQIETESASIRYYILIDAAAKWHANEATVPFGFSIFRYLLIITKIPLAYCLLLLSGVYDFRCCFCLTSTGFFRIWSINPTDQPTVRPNRERYTGERRIMTKHTNTYSSTQAHNINCFIKYVVYEPNIT